MTTDDLLTDLKALRNLLSTPDQWTQRERARDASGAPCSPWSQSAARWCLTGGTTRVVVGDQEPWALGDWWLRRDAMLYALGRRLRRKQPGWSLVCFNDHVPYREIIALIDGTIEEAKHDNR